VAMGNRAITTKASLQWYLSSDGPNTSVVTVAHNSDGHADVMYPLLLESIVGTSLVTSAHLLLLDRKHNLHLVCKKRQNLK
jgi:hypothetical protein